MKIVIVDTETGGLDAQNSAILSLGATIWENGTVADAGFHILIQEPEWEKHVDQKALDVNGLTREQIMAGASPGFVVTAFEQWLDEHGMFGRIKMGGHNVHFDIDFMKRLYRLADRKWPFDYHVFDTMAAAQILMLAGRIPVKHVNLDTLTKHFGIEIRADGVAGKHNALEDATAAAKLLTELVDLLKVHPLPIIGGSAANPGDT